MKQIVTATLLLLSLSALAADDRIEHSSQLRFATPIGAWILDEACKFAGRCRIGHVAINISPMQFRHPDFIDNVETTLARTNLDPGASPCR